MKNYLQEQFPQITRVMTTLKKAFLSDSQQTTLGKPLSNLKSTKLR